MTIHGKETAKYKAFMRDLRTLCRQHGVTIHAEGYDILQVWDWEDGRDNDKECVNSGGVADRTTKEK